MFKEFNVSKSKSKITSDEVTAINTDENLDEAVSELEQALKSDNEESSEDNVVSLSSNEMNELKKYKQEYLYLQAEFDNFRKRTVKERAELIKYGSEALAHELLNVLDVFDMAVATEVTAENLDSFKQGMDMTYSQLNDCLKRFGIEENSKPGDVFDPILHEAIGQEESEDLEEGQITKVFKKGYRFHEKNLRPAQVIVSSGNNTEE